VCVCVAILVRLLALCKKLSSYSTLCPCKENETRNNIYLFIPHVHLKGIHSAEASCPGWPQK